MGPIDNSAIADTVVAVLRSRPFARNDRISIGQLVVQWLISLIMRLFGFASTHPAVGFVLRTALAIAIIAALARVAFAVFTRYSPAPAGRHGDPRRGIDWWKRAHELASRDDYTGAAHALYLALLGSVAQRGLITLHESKTTGDYVRELRRKPDSVDLPVFTDFTRSYETVIYGIGTCDRERYARLDTLAGFIIDNTVRHRGFQP